MWSWGDGVVSRGDCMPLGCTERKGQRAGVALWGASRVGIRGPAR